MNWILASLLMFVFSVLLYVLIRKASLEKIPNSLINLASFLIPLFLYIPIGLYNKISFIPTIFQFFILLLLGIFCCYLGNIASLLSIKFAPNPGYSLIISKSYVVLTTIVAILFFHSSLSLTATIGIISIILFSILIMTGKNKTIKKSNPLWLPLSFGAFFAWGILTIGMKFLFTTGVGTIQLLIILAIIVSLIIIIEIVITKAPAFKINRSSLVLLISIGVFSGLFNYFLIVAISKTPNIGYVSAINAASISAVTLCSHIFFRDELTISKIIGIMGVTGGLIVLLIT